MKDDFFINNLIFHPKHEKELWREAYFPMDFIDLSISGFKDGRDRDPFLEKENKNTKAIRYPEPPAKNLFDKKADFISLGCSVTFGIGVGKGQAWDEIIANKLNLTHASISLAGGSTVWMINNFFSHVEKYGNPKIVLAFFPDFTRMHVASRKTEMVPESGISNTNDLIIRYKTQKDKTYRYDNKYFKKPLIAEEVFPLETAFDTSLQYIKMLEAYCNTNNIIFMWSTWVREQEHWLDNNIEETKFKNYISTGMRYWHGKSADERNQKLCKHLIDCYRPENFDSILEKHLHEFGQYEETFCDDKTPCDQYIDCHLEYKDEPYFSRASDAKKSQSGHMSYHRHIHVAESFMEKINDNNTGG